MIRARIQHVPLQRRELPGQFAVCFVAPMLLAGCQSAYYAAAEKVGFAKRDILTSRVKSARDSQQDAKQEITDALTEFGKNARAIAGLKGEVAIVDKQVAALVSELNKSIAEDDRFIAELDG